MPEYRIARYRGKWAVVWYVDGRRFRRSLGTSDRALAETRASILWQTLQRPLTASGTIAGLWAAYVHDKQGRPVLRAMETTAKALAPFMNMPPEAVTVQHCRDYRDMRRARGVQDGTVWTELTHLRTVVNWAEKRGIIPRAPYIELPRKPAPRDRYLTRDEARRLIDAAEFPHIRLYIILALTTAARNAAILELEWTRVDLSRWRIVLDSGKAGKRRATVPINTSAHNALTEAREASQSPYVIEWAGQRVKSVKRGFARAVELAGLEDVSPHCLRHTAAVWLAEAGTPMHEISQYLGHSDIKTTYTTYARYSPEFLSKAAGALEI